MSYTFRLYTNDDSFKRLPPIPAWVKEIQVALAFARDYDEKNIATNGSFKPYWDTNRVTASVINQFKEDNLHVQVKVLVSIGDRSGQYPFTVKASEKDLWVSKATVSLTSIIKGYNLDGIDVYYEHIKSGKHDFVDCIGKLIANLKEHGAVSVASISPTAPLNSNFYFPLYQRYNIYIGTVVYQCFTEPESINSVESLEEIFNTIANQFYPKEKLLAGGSTVSRDWDKVSPALYFIALFKLLITGTVAGPAIWVISDPPARGATSDSVTSFMLGRIMELLTLARSGRGNH